MFKKILSEHDAGISLVPNEEDIEKGKATFQIFSSCLGSEHIASEFALIHLCCLLRVKKISSVLEFGAGIGTMTYKLLSHLPELEMVTVTEDNIFCLEQLKTNIPKKYKKRLRILTNESELKDIEASFDLIILDGKYNIEFIAELLPEETIIFIEGSRKKTIADINDALKKRNKKLILKNYTQRTKFVHVYMRKSLKIPNFFFPKLSFNKTIKGFLIGYVSSSDK